MPEVVLEDEADAVCVGVLLLDEFSLDGKVTGSVVEELPGLLLLLLSPGGVACHLCLVGGVHFCLLFLNRTCRLSCLYVDSVSFC